MRRRMFRAIGVIVCGCSFQLVGCNNQEIADILAVGVKSTAVEVSTFFVGSFVDNAFGIE